MKQSAKFLVMLLLASIISATPVVPRFAYSEESREELEAELKNIEAQIDIFEKELVTTKTQKQTLTNKINQLKKEQNKVTLQIKAANLQIKELGKQLTSTQTSINTAANKIGLLKTQTTEILQAINQEGENSFNEMFIMGNELSVVFAKAETLEQLSGSLLATVSTLKAAKSELEKQHVNLENQQDQKKNILSIQKLQQQTLAVKANEQNKILKDTQGKEAEYQKMLADSKKRAKEIKSRIYELFGINNQITFGEAVDIADWVSKETGVRTALLLAVLTQESNLGKNVGTCNRATDPPSKSWKAVMKPDRDQAPFLAITKELGLDPDTTPVSCPLKDAQGKQMGYGGAMGPAQFIPSTWVLYKNRVTAITGKPANPWAIRDAFVAAALLLKDNGALEKDSKAEWRAAMRYFSGGTNIRYRFYGDNVIALAERYEDDIRALA